MISVIIPLYNVENYITDCLVSFEKQTYKDFELIIVNDGSTDDSASIVEKYSQNSNMTIRLINQKNSGVSSARNKGIDESIGEYLCFVDSDDLVGSEYLSEMIGTITNNNCNLVICGSKFVPEDWDIRLYSYKKHPTDIMNSYEALKRFLYQEIVSGVCFIMVKREVIKANKLYFSEGYNYSEDLEMMWKLIANSNSIAYSKNELYIYRIRKGSAMSVVDSKRMDGYYLMKGLEEYFQRVRPDFSEEFKRYGTSRWVWATLWQIVLASDNYRGFILSANKYNAKQHMKRLLSYPKFYVSMIAFLYLLSPRLYYYIMKKVGMKRLKNRALTT